MANGRGLSYFHVPPTEQYIYQTIPERLEQWAVIQPEKPAVIVRHSDSKREVITCGQLFRSILQVAKQLIHLGVQKGDRVAVVSRNSVAWALAEFGVVAAGAVAVNLMLGDAIDCLNNAIDVDCVAIILDARHVKSEEEFDGLAVALDKERLAQDRRTVNVILIHDDYQSGSCIDFKTLIETHPSHKRINVPKDIDPDDVCIMFPTSGTTGKSKFVQRTHMTLINGALGKRFAMEATGVAFSDRPMGHAGGFPWGLLIYGSTLVYVDTSATVTDEQTSFVIDVMREEHVTKAPIQPYLLLDLQRARAMGKVLPSLRTCIIGGQMITKRMMNDLSEFVQIPFFIYGMTEVPGVFFLPYHRPFLEQESLGGFPSESVEVKIVADDETLVPFGEEGEICIRVFGATQPYILHDGSLCESADPKGWFHTGDMGTLRSDGFLVVYGRKKEMIKRGTIKIYPTVIEEELMKHSDIDQVVVVAVPDPRLYEDVCACVVLKMDHYLTKEMLKNFAATVFSPSSAADGKGNMPGYFLILEDIPLLPSGKPDKIILAQMAIQHLSH